MIVTACVACKNQFRNWFLQAKNPVCWTWFLQLDFSKIKYRSTGGKTPQLLCKKYIYLHLFHFRMLTRPLLIAIRGWIEIDSQIQTGSYWATLNLQGSNHSFLFLSFFWIVWESASYRVVAKNEKNINNYCLLLIVKLFNWSKINKFRIWISKFFNQLERVLFVHLFFRQKNDSHFIILLWKFENTKFVICCEMKDLMNSLCISNKRKLNNLSIYQWTHGPST